MFESIQDYRSLSLYFLENYLPQLKTIAVRNRMAQANAMINFTENLDTWETKDARWASFQNVSPDPAINIIAYVTNSQAGYGIYNQKLNACCQITTTELLRTWEGEPDTIERQMIKDLCLNTQSIITSAASRRP